MGQFSDTFESSTSDFNHPFAQNKDVSSSSPQHKLNPNDLKRLEVIEGILKSHFKFFGDSSTSAGLEGRVCSSSQKRAILVRSNIANNVWHALFAQKTLSTGDQKTIIRLVQEIFHLQQVNQNLSEDVHVSVRYSSFEDNELIQSQMGVLFHQILSIVHANDMAIYKETLQFVLKDDEGRDGYCVLRALDTLAEMKVSPFIEMSQEASYPHFPPVSYSPETREMMLKSEKGKNFLYRILIEKIKTDLRQMPELLNYLGINSSTEEGLQKSKELAKQVGTIYPRLLPLALSLLAPIDQKSIIEVVKFAAEKNPSTVSLQISRFEIDSHHLEGQTALIEIAKTVARARGDAIIETIKMYGIKDQKALVKIAHLAYFESRGPSQDWHLNNFDFVDPKDLISLVRALISKYPQKTLQLIEHLNVDGKIPEWQEVLIEMALLAAKENPGKISKQIKKFQIDSTTEQGQSALVKVAKLEALTPLSKLAMHIPQYEISDSHDLIEIAKIIAVNSVDQLLKNLKNFRINENTFEGQNSLIAIAKHVALQPQTNICFFIQDYQIKDEKALIEIALIAARNPLSEISSEIKNFGIKDKEGLIQIAKVAATYNYQEFVDHIELYEIEDQEALIALAMIIVSQEGTISPAQFDPQNRIDRQTEQGQRKLIAIAKRAVETSGHDALRLFNDYGIRHLENKLLIFARGDVCQDPRNQYSVYFSDFFFAEDLEELQKKFPILYLLKIDDSEENREIFDQMFRETFLKAQKNNHFKNPFFDEMLTKIAAQPNFQVKTRLYRCFAFFLLVCQIHELSDEQIIRIKPLVEILYELRNPSLRTFLQCQLNDGIADPNFINTWLEMFEKADRKKQSALPCLILAPHLDKIGKPFFEKQIAPHLKHAFFKDGPRLNALMSGLKAVLETPNLSFDEKKELLKLIFASNSNSATVLKNAQQIFHLMNFSQFEELKTLKDIAAVEKTIKSLFIRELGISEIDGFSQKFLDTFAKFRHPNAPFAYMSILKKLVDPQKSVIMSLYSEYATTVLEGTFKEKRYDISRSPHLQEVFHKRPELEKQWKEGSTFAIEALMSEQDSSVVRKSEMDFPLFFEHKILTDNHFPQDSIPLLVDVLKKPELREEKLLIIADQLKELKHKLGSQDKGQTIEVKESNIKLTKLLTIQQIMLELLVDDLSTDEKLSKVIRLTMLIGELNKINQVQYEFLNDLKGLQESLMPAKEKRQESKMSQWKVLDTDDPCDLLLLGTEVAGSCQRIDGLPDYNKCLVSYLMDGKNRALVIKDETGKIAARSVLRLLLNGQTKQPVLFQERVYPDFLDPSLVVILNKACLERAKQLALPLFSIEGSGEVSRASFISLGGCAPYEYVDAAEGVKPNSIFEIYGAKKVEAN